MLEFVFREDEARFGATRAGITAVRLIGGLQKELMKWQAMQKKVVKKSGTIWDWIDNDDLYYPLHYFSPCI